jgi:hypothetical protein
MKTSEANTTKKLSSIHSRTALKLGLWDDSSDSSREIWNKITDVRTLQTTVPDHNAIGSDKPLSASNRLETQSAVNNTIPTVISNAITRNSSAKRYIPIIASRKRNQE